MKIFRLGEFGVRQNDTDLGGMKEGESVITHNHNFSHLTAVWGHMLIEVLEGPPESDIHEQQDGTKVTTVSVKVIRSAEFGEHLGRTLCLVEAHTWHRLTALKDDSQYRCIYTSRDADGIPSVNWSGELSPDFI